MVQQPEPYRQYRDAYQQRRFADVVRDGDELAAALDRSPKQQVFVPAVALLQGSALAELEEYVEACRYLEYGLDRYAESEASHLRELGGADWFSLRLVELQTMLGRYGDAWSLLTSLEEPDKAPGTRLAAIRGRAALNTIRGEYEGAHQLLNAATSVIERINSQFLAAEVDADRAVVLATQGRLREAITLADRTFEHLARPASGGKGVWAARTTASVALTLSRSCTEAHQLPDADRFLLIGTAAAERAPTSYLSAHLDVTISMLWRTQGSAGSAEPLCREAAHTFARLGCRPAEALATFELARLAEARGMETSARPLLERARDEFAFLGHARELHDSEALLRRHQPPPVQDHTAFLPPAQAPTPPPDLPPTPQT